MEKLRMTDQGILYLFLPMVLLQPLELRGMAAQVKLMSWIRHLNGQLYGHPKQKTPVNTGVFVYLSGLYWIRTLYDLNC